MLSFFSIIFGFFGSSMAFSVSVGAFSASIFAFAAIFCCFLVSTLFSSVRVSALLSSLANWRELMFFFRTPLSTVLSRIDSQIMIKIYSHFYIFTTKLYSGIRHLLVDGLKYVDI